MTERGPKILGQLLTKDGVIVVGDPDLKCPHCGAAAVVREGVTPNKKTPIRVYVPNFSCCARSRMPRGD